MSCSLGLPRAIVKFSKCSYELSLTAVLMGAREHMRKGCSVATRGKTGRHSSSFQQHCASAKRQDVGVRNTEHPLEQPSPTFLALGTGSAEDSFSTDQGWGQVVVWG